MPDHKHQTAFLVDGFPTCVCGSWWTRTERGGWLDPLGEIQQRLRGAFETGESK